MFTYNEDERIEKSLAIFYATAIKSDFAIKFFSGNFAISTSDEAIIIAKSFYQMASRASEDHLNNVEVLDGVDIEFWMLKIFNKTYGHYLKNNFMSEFNSAANDT